MVYTRKVMILRGFSNESLPVLPSLCAFYKKIIVTDTLQCTEDNLFEIPCKSKEDNLHDTVEDMQSMLRSESPLQDHTDNPRANAIDKLRELLLRPITPAEIIPLPPRVKGDNNNTQFPRVTATNTDDPPVLEDEADDVTSNYDNLIFKELKQQDTILPPLLQDQGRHNIRHNLRPSPPHPRRIATL